MALQTENKSNLKIIDAINNRIYNGKYLMTIW